MRDRDIRARLQSMDDAKRAKMSTEDLCQKRDALATEIIAGQRSVERKERRLRVLKDLVESRKDAWPPQLGSWIEPEGEVQMLGIIEGERYVSRCRSRVHVNQLL